MVVCVAVVLPFETPLVRLGPLTVTTCELAIYLLLATWAIGVVARGTRAGLGRAVSALWRDEISPSARDPIGRAVAVWIAVTVLAGLAAPSERIPALKFALRALSGGLLFFCARDLAGTAARIRTFARDETLFSRNLL